MTRGEDLKGRAEFKKEKNKDNNNKKIKDLIENSYQKFLANLWKRKKIFNNKDGY